jgi:tRNA G18 (ribose-2'-O)-methylase SpoU
LNNDLQKRNIIDKYANWMNDEIRKDLDKKRHNFSVLAVNLELDINTCGILRTCNLFLAKEFFLYGRKHINTKGAVGANHYEHITFVQCVNDFPWDAYNVIGIDNVCGSKPIETYEWDFSKELLLCFGQETSGLTPEIAEKCDEFLHITQYGSLRCYNVSVAAGIVMYDYTTKLNFRKQ